MHLSVRSDRCFSYSLFWIRSTRELRMLLFPVNVTAPHRSRSEASISGIITIVNTARGWKDQKMIRPRVISWQEIQRRINCSFPNFSSARQIFRKAHRMTRILFPFFHDAPRRTGPGRRTPLVTFAWQCTVRSPRKWSIRERAESGRKGATLQSLSQF